MTASTPKRIKARWLQAENLQQVFAIVQAAGGEARVAGGAVRNALMKQPIADVDLATTLPPARILEIFTKAGHLVIPTGLDHGTVTVRIDHQNFEITTLRNDVETDGRRAKVSFTDDWQADAARRDFTINALYLDHTGKLYDYTNGYRDIQTRHVRFVGSPAKRIAEDYLRILRFFRFHASYGKGGPDPAGLAACIRLRNGLKKLSAERICAELLKLLAAPGAVATLKIMHKSKVLGVVLPEARKLTPDMWRNINRLPPDAILRLHLLATDVSALKERLKLSNAQAARLSAMSEAPDVSPDLRQPEQRRMLFLLGDVAWKDAVVLAWARSRATKQDRRWKQLLTLPDRWQRPVMPVTGKHIMDRGIAPGPQIGQILRDLQDWWVACDFKPSRDELLARIEIEGQSA